MNTILTLLSSPKIADCTAGGFWRDETIYALVATQADRNSDRAAIRESDRVTTFRELVDAADRLAAAFAGAGLREGDRVAVWLPSRAEVAAAVLACSRRGYIVCPSLHRDHTVAEVAGLIRRMRAAAVIMQPGYGADANEHDLASELATTAHVRITCVLDEDHTGTMFPGYHAADAAPIHRDPNSIVYLAFTSGTTGEPKGVMHSDNTLLAPTRALAQDWSLDAGSTIYSMSPLSHNLGFGAMLLSTSIGAEFIVHDLPRHQSLAARLNDTGTTFAFGVPTHAIDLLTELKDNPGLTIDTLKGFRISGAAIPPVVAQGLIDHGVVPQSGYGMTEAGSHHYTLPSTPTDKITGSSGKACAGYEVAIFSRDDPDTTLPAGEVGQIGGRGASLMLGYFDNQAATETSFNATGWFLTGDLGWMDDDGYLHITGRKKDVIIRGGHNIFPAKIENLMMRHSSVVKVAAIPITDDRLGEKVGLILQIRDGMQIGAPELFDHLRQAGLSKYDMPEYLGFVTEMPTTASGKILKRRLTEWIDCDDLTVQPIRFTPNATTTGA